MTLVDRDGAWQKFIETSPHKRNIELAQQLVNYTRWLEGQLREKANETDPTDTTAT